MFNTITITADWTTMRDLIQTSLRSISNLNFYSPVACSVYPFLLDISDSSRNPLNTKLAASGVRLNKPDYRDVTGAKILATCDTIYCSSHTNDSCTNQQADDHYAARNKQCKHYLFIFYRIYTESIGQILNNKIYISEYCSQLCTFLRKQYVVNQHYLHRFQQSQALLYCLR